MHSIAYLGRFSHSHTNSQALLHHSTLQIRTPAVCRLKPHSKLQRTAGALQLLNQVKPQGSQQPLPMKIRNQREQSKIFGVWCLHDPHL